MPEAVYRVGAAPQAAVTNQKAPSFGAPSNPSGLGLGIDGWDLGPGKPRKVRKQGGGSDVGSVGSSGRLATGNGRSMNVRKISLNGSETFYPVRRCAQAIRRMSNPPVAGPWPAAAALFKES